MSPPVPAEIVHPRLQSGAIARPLNFTVRRFGGELIVPIGPTVARLLLAAPFLFQLAMLALQITALGRYRHSSFLLLAVAALCGLLFLAMQVGFAWWHPHQQMLGVWFWVSTLALLIQMILGLWGTASLFRSYGQLAAESVHVNAGRSV